MKLMQSIASSPRVQMISGAVVASLPHIARLRPALGVYSVPAAIIGMGLMVYGGLEKANQDAVKLSDKTKKDNEDVRIKTQAKWTPIEISKLSEDNLKKMNNEEPLLPKAVQEKIDTQLSEIGNWKSNIGVNGISQTYQSALLYGPTGSGKSSVARKMISKFDAKAQEEGRTHYHIKIEPTMLSSENGNAKLAKLLDDIKHKVTTEGADKVAFSILMDECDGALKVGLETANQYNTMIDAFTKEMNVPILQILTTNHLDDIDARTIRLGRCGTKIEIPNPDAKTKVKIMEQALEQFTFHGNTLKEACSLAAADLAQNGNLSQEQKLAEKFVNSPMTTVTEKLINSLTKEELDCQVYNPITRKNESQKKSLQNLLDDETISGATISEITLTMIKKLAIKAETKEKAEPKFNNFAFTCFGASAFMRLLNDLNDMDTAGTFISDYDVKTILTDAIGEALTQKALEEHNISSDEMRKRYKKMFCDINAPEIS